MLRIVSVFILACAVLGCSDTGPASPPDVGPDAPVAPDSAPGADTVAPDAGLPDAAAGDASPTACPVKGYSPCGGDLLGAWSFVSLCPEDQARADALFEHPYDNLTECKDRTKNTVEAAQTRSGTLTFDKTSVAVKFSSQVELTYGFTDACLAAARPAATTPSAACAVMNKPGKLACTYITGLCTCKGTVKAPDEDSSVPYTLSSGVLTLSPGKESATYCRKGDVMILDWTPHPISWRYWILTRL